MILINGQTYNNYVYSVPGYLCSIEDYRDYKANLNNGIKSVKNIKNNNLSNYPNPTANNSTTIEYQLPQGEREGSIVVYDINGREVKKFRVDNNFNNIVLSTQDLQAGTYFYSLQTSQGVVGSKKMVVIK